MKFRIMRLKIFRGWYRKQNSIPSKPGVIMRQLCVQLHDKNENLNPRNVTFAFKFGQGSSKTESSKWMCKIFAKPCCRSTFIGTVEDKHQISMYDKHLRMSQTGTRFDYHNTKKKVTRQRNIQSAHVSEWNSSWMRTHHSHNL